MARGLNALGCVPLAPPPIRPIIGTPFLSFLAGGTHICRPRAHLAARATDTRMGPPNGPPSGKGFRIAKKAQKKARLGVNEPQIGVSDCLEIPENYDTGKQSEETSPISRPGCRSCRSWRRSPRLGIRTSEERPEERREKQQVRDVSDNFHRPSVEPVARGGSPRGIPRGRRRRAPSPRSGRRARIYHPEDCEPRAVGPIDVLTPRRAAFHLREATRYSSSRSRCHSSRTESEFCARAPGSAVSVTICRSAIALFPRERLQEDPVLSVIDEF